MKYLKIFTDFKANLELLSEAEIGRLFLAMIEYAENGVETDLEGNEFINNLVTKRFDCAAELGAGFDIYNQWFKLGIEVKMSYGFLNVMKNPAFIYTAPIDKLRNKLFQVSLIVE